MSSHDLAAFANPFQLSLSPETAFAEPTGNSYPLPVLLLDGLYGHFICVWASDVVSRGCVHVRVNNILPGRVWVRWDLITSTPQTSCHSTIIRISSSPGWPGRGLVCSCLCCWLKLGPASSTNLGVSSSSSAELCSLLALTSWESTWVLLSWWSLSESARRAVPLFLCRDGKELSKWTPHQKSA